MSGHSEQSYFEISTETVMEYYGMLQKIEYTHEQFILVTFTDATNQINFAAQLVFSVSFLEMLDLT